MKKIKNLIKQILPYGLITFYRQKKQPQENQQFKKFKDTFDNIHANLENNRFTCLWEDRKACLNDQTPNTKFDAHYLYHPAWAARRIREVSPEKHIDISFYIYNYENIYKYLYISYFSRKTNSQAFLAHSGGPLSP